MKKINFKKTSLIAMAIFTIAASSASCSKDADKPSNPAIPGSGTHIVDARLIGTWMWSDVGDAAMYNDNGVYNGPSYGLALQYKINADGSGTDYNHLYSGIGAGSSLEINISSTGFFESDTEGHLGYFPTGGHYTSTSGEDRALYPAELWDTNTGSGKSYLYQKLLFKTVGGRKCFEVTSSDGITDTYFKVE